VEGSIEFAIVIGIVIAGLTGKVVHALFLAPRVRLKRALKSTPRTHVHQIAEGAVRVTGTAHQRDGLLQAPISQRPCLAYQLCVDSFDDEGMTTVLDLKDVRPFVVADQTGKVLVAPDGHFELALVEDAKGSDVPRLMDANTRALLVPLLERANIPHTSSWGPHRFRFREGVLEEGELVSVLGQAGREVHTDGERPHPRSPPERIVLRGSSTVPLRISDDPSTQL
jgi:hypothetical protein